MSFCQPKACSLHPVVLHMADTDHEILVCCVMMALLAFVFAAPLAWWAMAKWLNTFVYRVSLGAGVFALAMPISLFIVVVTVGYQAMRAALMNPVKALRFE